MYFHYSTWLNTVPLNETPNMVSEHTHPSIRQTHVGQSEYMRGGVSESGPRCGWTYQSPEWIITKNNNVLYIKNTEWQYKHGKPKPNRARLKIGLSALWRDQKRWSIKISMLSLYTIHQARTGNLYNRANACHWASPHVGRWPPIGTGGKNGERVVLSTPACRQSEKGGRNCGKSPGPFLLPSLTLQYTDWN